MNKTALFGGEMVEANSRNKVTECLRPLLISMRLCGLYFSRRSEGADVADRNKCRQSNGWMIYAVFVMVLLWINAARVFSVFTSEDTFGLMLLNKMIFVIWAVQCAISQTAFYASCHLGALRDVFLTIRLSDECASYVRKVAIICTIVAWSIIVMSSAFFVYGLFFTGGFMDFTLAPIQNHVTTSDPLVPRIFVYFLTFYLLSAHVFPQATTFLLSMLISFQFRSIENALGRCLDRQNGLVEDTEIESTRQQHQTVSMSVSRLDDCLMFSNASAFCCQLSSLIIQLYMLIFYHSVISDPVVVATLVMWIILMSFGLILTAAAGIMINHYVSKQTALTIISASQRYKLLHIAHTHYSCRHTPHACQTSTSLHECFIKTNIRHITLELLLCVLLMCIAGLRSVMRLINED